MQVPSHPTLVQRMLDARVKRLASRTPALAASVARVARHCGRPSCHCLRSGAKHLAHQVTFKVAGKTRTVDVPKDLLQEVRSGIAEHQRPKHLQQEIHLLRVALIRQHAQHRNRRQGRP